MSASFQLWLEYLLRFSHLVAGISWIGSSFYFIWLDSAFQPLETPKRNVDGEVFMVHGGFYYQVEKRKIYPGELPKVLHWFKWEATLTWVTGFLLFTVLYWLKNASLLIDPSIHSLSQEGGIFASLAFMAGSWLVYDLIWSPRILKVRGLSLALSVLFFSWLIHSLFHTFSGRGAFTLTGAIFGSLMLLNVWVRILPGQTKMLKDAQDGKVPDYSLGLKSKVRSVHNTYFTFPVLFIMLSNHYPQVYTHPRNWALLILLALSGALVRHAMVTKNLVGRWMLIPAGAGLVSLVFMTVQPEAATTNGGRVEFAEVRAVIERRCIQCHSTRPTDDVYKVPPSGVIFESEADIRGRADKIHLHVVEAKSMPLVNKTGMTDGERGLFARWLSQEGLTP